MKSPRQKTKERDNFQCQVCGAKTNLHVHHIDESGEKRWNPDTKKRERIPPEDINNSLENLVTLCQGCHSSITRLLHRNTINAIKILQKIKRG
jgi:5-methylcytosine-specific restriction endonuclease McrA